MEEILPPQTESGAGFELTRVRQFTVFMENRVGSLQMLVRAYEEAGGKLVSLSIQNSADTALVRIICSDPDLGREVLQKGRFAFTEQDLLVVELPRGTSLPLSHLCSVLLSAEINIHYAYPLLLRPKGPAVALYVDDHVLAAQLMMRKGFTIVGESDLRRC
jgi:hypothetical protein